MGDWFFRGPLFGIPVVTDAECGRRMIEDLNSRAASAEEEPTVRAGIEALCAEPTARSILDGVFSNSPFLANCAIADPAFLVELMTIGPDNLFGRIIVEIKDELAYERDQPRLMAALRVARRKVALLVAVADVTGHWTLDRVTQALSDFIDGAISATVCHLMRHAADSGDIVLHDARFPEDECGLFILSMGKHGARELNYSSDVDLMVFYEPMKVDFRGDRGVQRSFIRLTQQLVKILQERTADGYVCRVDLRLRPDPGSTPVAVTYAAGITYYSSRGSTWERAAMIKGRAAAGDVALGRRFLDELAPFIWRDHLDFWTLREIAAIKRQINEQRGGGEIAFLGHNIKLGRGGIREIEFYAQTQQLIYAGQDAYLRCNRTVDALSTLAESGCIDERTADELTEAYEFLRQLEHRLQMVDDQQTQTLPSDPDEMARIAGFMGYDDVADLEQEVRRHLDQVETSYYALFENADQGLGLDTLDLSTESPNPETLGLLDGFGFRDVAGAYECLRRWQSGCFTVIGEPRGQALLDALTPGAIEALGRTTWPDFGLERLDWFLAGLPAELRCLSLLSANPPVLALLIDVLQAAPALAETVRARPDMLEPVLAQGFSAPLPDERFMFADGTETLRSVTEPGEARRRITAWAAAFKFQVGVGVLRHATDSAEAGVALAAIADVVLRCLHGWLTARDGNGDSGTAVIVLGAYGTRTPVLTDPLEVIFVHEDDGENLADGSVAARALGAALTDPGDDGPIYELRSEPLVLTHAELRRQLIEAGDPRLLSAAYQARAVAGPPGLVAAVSATLDEARRTERNGRNGRDLAMRLIDARIEDRPPPAHPIWDVRHRDGGLFDLETLIQLWQLRHAPDNPELSTTSPVAPARQPARRRGGWGDRSDHGARRIAAGIKSGGRRPGSGRPRSRARPRLLPHPFRAGRRHERPALAFRYQHFIPWKVENRFTTKTRSRF
jgi:glutamate-ammonia-ligase adenylyltransferase